MACRVGVDGELEDEQGDRDREDSVAERIEATERDLTVRLHPAEQARRAA